MYRYLILFIILFSSSFSFASPDEKSIQEKYTQAIDEPGAAIFTPPKGWKITDPKLLPAHVKVMVVGEAKKAFPPSINLGTEKYEGTLKSYLEIVKTINESQGIQWKDLGTIQTQQKITGSLSQIIQPTEWGQVKMMHMIIYRDGIIYIMTAAALKEEFLQYTPLFLETFKSLRFNPPSKK